MSVRGQVGLSTLRVVDEGSWDIVSFQITSEARTRGMGFTQVPGNSETMWGRGQSLGKLCNPFFPCYHWSAPLPLGDHCVQSLMPGGTCRAAQWGLGGCQGQGVGRRKKSLSSWLGWRPQLLG